MPATPEVCRPVCVVVVCATSNSVKMAHFVFETAVTPLVVGMLAAATSLGWAPLRGSFGAFKVAFSAEGSKFRL